MHERIHNLHLALTLSTLFTLGAALQNQPEVEGCFDTDKANSTVYWASKEDGIPKRVVPHPNSEEIGIWVRGTKLISLCTRNIILETDGRVVSTFGYLVRAENDETDLGWIIPNLDQPGLSPTSAGLPPPPDPIWSDEEE